MRIGLITIAPFPIGNVTTIRYSSYLEELVRHNHYAKVYIYTPTRMAKHITNKYGEHGGIEYEYTSKITLSSRNFIIRLYYLLLGLTRSVCSIRRDKIDTLIINEEHSFIIMLFYKVLSKLLGLRFLWEKTEYPAPKYYNSYNKKFYDIKVKWFDGMVVITKELQSFFENIRKDENIFLLPMTIPMSRFEKAVKNKNQEKYIAVVFGVHNRDGLKESILSYEKYRDMGGSWGLLLCGNYVEMPNKVELDAIIRSSQYQEDICIKGVVNIEEMPTVLVNASMLLTTPNSYVSGGFPTKLGEYMLAGVPIVSTIAGEITQYVEPNKEVLFANPGDIQSIATQMYYVETHREESLTMARQAQEKVRVVFNAYTYIGSMERFLENSL